MLYIKAIKELGVDQLNTVVLAFRNQAVYPRVEESAVLAELTGDSERWPPAATKSRFSTEMVRTALLSILSPISSSCESISYNTVNVECALLMNLIEIKSNHNTLYYLCRYFTLRSRANGTSWTISWRRILWKKLVVPISPFRHSSRLIYLIRWQVRACYYFLFLIIAWIIVRVILS